MKKVLSVLLVLCMSVSLLSGVTVLASAAESGTCGENVTWTLEDGTLTISGTGAMENYSLSGAAPWDSSGESIQSVVIEDGVTSIGDWAFYDCYFLKSVTIPDSVTSIGSSAFSCCDSLTKVTIGNSVTSIGDEAFCNCESLTSVTIPNSVTSIGDRAFCNCKSLNAFTVAEDNPNYSSVDGNLYNKEQTELIQYAAGKTETAFTIPNSVTSVGSRAFYQCKSLKSITIPDSVTSVGLAAFFGCDALTSVTIPESVTSIGEWAFYNCDSLTSITIPEGVTSVGECAFYGCDDLKSITILEGVTSIGEEAFSYCYDLKWVAIPISLEMIGRNAFYSCSDLTDVYYKGDEAAREEIAIPSGNDYFKNATWHYNAEPVTELPGDVNLDENVDISDAVTLFQYSMLPDLYPIEYRGDLDFTKDGVVDISDAVLLFQHSMLPDLYPIG